MKLIIILVLLFSANTNADSFSVSLASRHIQTEHDEFSYNEINLGLIYYTNNLFVGGFHNSYDDATFVVGRRYTNNEFGLDLGLTYYRRFNYKADRILPMVQVTYDIFNWRVGLIPTFSRYTHGTFTLQYTFNLK